MIDAVVTAGGRLPPDLAARYHTDVKALVRIGDATLIERIITALRGVAAVTRIVVVGPELVRSAAAADQFILERATGEENLLAALDAAREDRTLFCASDMPLVSTRALADLLDRAPHEACTVYPVYTRDEFESAFPGGRSSYAALADGAWTGASALVVRAGLLARHTDVITRAFGARKNVMALAGLFGPALTFAYLRGALRVADVESRVTKLLGAPAVALRGADPALALDCDDEADFTYVEAWLARSAR